MNFVYRDPKYPESFIFPAKRLSGAMVSELYVVFFVKKFGGIPYYIINILQNICGIYDCLKGLNMHRISLKIGLVVKFKNVK